MKNLDMKMIDVDLGHILVLKKTNSFGDLILKFVEDYGEGAETTLTYQEGSWPSLTEDEIFKIYKRYC